MWSNERHPVFPQQLVPLKTIPGSTLYSNFSPKMFNGAADKFDKKAYSNGDGMLIFPGKHGTALPSIRLENLRDGMEDYGLLAHLPASTREQLIAKAITYKTGWPSSPSVEATQGVNVTV
eukprot:SAG11_NODE_5747_length_1472_cov_5.530226_1_plen_119_part_10